MECEICDGLLANYKSCVRLFTNAQRSLRGAIGDDFQLALKELKHLKQACEDADRALLDHWRQDHGNYLDPKA